MRAHLFRAIAVLTPVVFASPTLGQGAVPLFTPPNAPRGLSLIRSTDYNGDGQIDYFDYLDFVAFQADLPASPTRAANLQSFLVAFDSEEATWVCQIDPPPGVAPGVIIPHAPSERATGLAVEDVNLDARADLITVRFGTVNVRIQLAGGTFAAPTPAPALLENNLSTSNFSLINVAGGAAPDMVWVASEFQPPPAPPIVRVQVLVNDGTGNFAPPVDTDVPGGTLGAMNAAPQSTGGPVIIGAVRSSGIAVFRAVGASVQLVNPVDGTLLPPGTNSSAGTVSFVSGLRELLMTDLNADGNTDLVTTNYTNVLFRPGNGNGTFGPMTTLTGFTGTNALAAEDLNNDGLQEILSVNFNQETLNIWRATAPLVYAPRSDHPTGVNPAGMVFTREVTPTGTRINGLHILNTNDATFTAYPVLPDGTVVTPQRLDGPSNTTDTAAGDFDGDGYTDIAASGALGRVSVYLNAADGSGKLASFSPSDGENQAGTNIKSFITVRGDTPTIIGRDRFALAVTDRFATAFYKPGGPEGNRIDIEQLVICPSTVTTLGAMDLNADGRTDIVSLYPGSTPAAQAWLQSGTGGFTVPVNLNSSFAGWNQVIDTRNGSGVGLPTTWVMLHDFETGATEVQNFNGTAFAFEKFISAGAPSVDAAVGDIDGDGVADLITVHPGLGTTGRRVSVVTGITTATPSAPVFTDLPRTPTRVAAADFDFDGDTDVLVSTAGLINTNQSAMLIPNQGGSLNPFIIQFFSAGAQARRLLAVDLNNPTGSRGGTGGPASAPELIAAEFDPPTLDRLGGITVNPNLASVPPSPACRADFNEDGVVNTPDLIFFLGRFGEAATPGSPAERADFNANGTVDTPDLIFFLGRFGETCP